VARRFRFPRLLASKSVMHPLAINHLGQFPVVNLSFNLAPGVSLGDATTAIEKAEREINLPRSISSSFQGTAAAFHNSLSSEPWLHSGRDQLRFTLCWACFMRAIFTPSRFSPRCLGRGGSNSRAADYRQRSRVGRAHRIILLIGIVKKTPS